MINKYKIIKRRVWATLGMDEMLEKDAREEECVLMVEQTRSDKAINILCEKWTHLRKIRKEH